MRSERERLARYRNTLGNLAHSFKTPLAVMRNLLERRAGARPAGRASSSTSRSVAWTTSSSISSSARPPRAAPVSVLRRSTCAARSKPLRGALLKVYVERNIDCELIVAPGCLFTGDREDLTEIAGNLLDNAFKWAAAGCG